MAQCPYILGKIKCFCISPFIISQEVSVEAFHLLSLTTILDRDIKCHYCRCISSSEKLKCGWKVYLRIEEIGPHRAKIQVSHFIKNELKV